MDDGNFHDLSLTPIDTNRVTDSLHFTSHPLLDSLVLLAVSCLKSAVLLMETMVTQLKLDIESPDTS